MEKYYLAKYKVNYANEFAVSGMRLFTQKELDKFYCYQHIALYVEKEGRLGYDISEDGIYFGTNEAIRFKNISETISAIKVQEITEDEYNTLIKLGLSSFGTQALFNFFENFCE